MEKLLTMSDTINVGKNKKVTVESLVPIKGEIFKLIKKGLQFDDEVLKEAHITKIIRDVKVENEIVSHEKEKKSNYSRETESLKSILKSVNVLENQTAENTETEETAEDIPTDNILEEEDD